MWLTGGTLLLVLRVCPNKCCFHRIFLQSTLQISLFAQFCVNNTGLLLTEAISFHDFSFKSQCLSECSAVSFASAFAGWTEVANVFGYYLCGIWIDVVQIILSCLYCCLLIL